MMPKAFLNQEKMIKSEKDGWEIYTFHCEKCNHEYHLTINEFLQEITCPTWQCEAIYKHKNGDLIFVGYTQNPFFKRRENYVRL